MSEDTVPIGELEALIEEWRNNSYPTDHDARKRMPYRTGVGRGYNRAANDLIETIVEAHRDE